MLSTITPLLLLMFVVLYRGRIITAFKKILWQK
jgi:hypothetical protein